jgi:hypothetical protein
MKQRMIVMNGQRIVESEQAEEKWQIAKVDKAHGIKPGIYNLYTSSQAVKTTEYAGVILHTDKSISKLASALLSMFAWTSTRFPRSVR